MKRIGNLYQNIYKFENIVNAYNEVCRNTKNKKKVENLDVNVASRKNMGTSKGIDLSLKFHKKCKIKYDHYYILKCDISKFFYSINHDNLKQIQIFYKRKDFA